MSTDYRAMKSGLAREHQKKIEANYDAIEATKCLYWIKLVTDVPEIPPNAEDIDPEPNSVHALLHDGIIVCRLIDALYPGQINWNNKTFKVPMNEAMKRYRERERISMFTTLCQSYGVPDMYTFPTESLHEKGALNLAQVMVCLRILGIEAQTKPDYNGPAEYWPKKTEPNVRKFTDEQLSAGKSIIGLQMGTNKGANQSGIIMGKSRMIID